MCSQNRRSSGTASAASGPNRASRFAVRSGPHQARSRHWSRSSAASPGISSGPRWSASTSAPSRASHSRSSAAHRRAAGTARAPRPSTARRRAGSERLPSEVPSEGTSGISASSGVRRASSRSTPVFGPSPLRASASTARSSSPLRSPSASAGRAGKTRVLIPNRIHGSQGHGSASSSASSPIRDRAAPSRSSHQATGQRSATDSSTRIQCAPSRTWARSPSRASSDPPSASSSSTSIARMHASSSPASCATTGPGDSSRSRSSRAWKRPRSSTPSQRQSRRITSYTSGAAAAGSCLARTAPRPRPRWSSPSSESWWA